MATRIQATSRGIANRSPVSYPPTAEVEIPLITSVHSKFWIGAAAFTRSSPATFKDFEWNIRTVKSWEPRFEGSRRVENWVTYSELLTDASWSKTNVAITLDTQTINGSPVFKMTNDATNAVHSFSKTTGTSVLAWNKCIVSCIAKAWTSNFIQIFVGTSFSTEYVNIDLSSGTAVQGNTSQAQVTLLSSGFYRVSLLINCLVSGSINVFCNIITSWTTGRNVGYIGAGEYIYATAFQMENVTGQSIQTVGEYVPSNILWFSYNSVVDAVKCFDTDLLGNKIYPKGYYAEWARTNLFLQSNQFDTTWTKNAAQLNITANATIWPDGAMSMWKLSPWVGSALQSVIQSVTTTAAVYTYTVYAKAGENTVLQLLASSAISNGYVNFDLSNGTIGSSSLWTGSIESVGNGIYRCIAITDTLVATTNSIHLSQVPTRTTGRAGNINGNGSDWIYVYGAQFELWAFPSTYIPTTTTTATRNADVLSYNALNANSVYWAFYWEFILPFVPTVGIDRRAFAITANTNNRLQLVITTPSANYAAVSMWNGSTVLSSTLWIAATANTVIKVWAKWVNSSIGNVFQNGQKSPNITSPVIAATQFDVGNVWGAPIFGTIRNLKFWKVPPTDAEMQAITL